MPSPSDDAVHRMLEAETTAGGDWELVLSSTVPADGLGSGITVIAGVTPVTLPRDSSIWDTPASRRVQLIDPVSFGAYAGTETVALAWVLRDPSDDSPQYACQIRDLILRPGSTHSLAASQVFIRLK